METGFWIVGGLVALVLVFQLYQWIEVVSARRDMMRAHADATRSMLVRGYRVEHGGHTNPPPDVVGAKKPLPPPHPPARNPTSPRASERSALPQPPAGFEDWVNRTPPSPRAPAKKRRRR